MVFSNVEFLVIWRSIGERGMAILHVYLVVYVSYLFVNYLKSNYVSGFKERVIFMIYNNFKISYPFYDIHL